MITRNEEKFLQRCLGSVQGIVDEIVVVDTGSVDRTIGVARSFCARIYHFEWTEDFSAARNFSLSKANGDWIFSLDADETISGQDQTPLRNLFRSAAAGSMAYSITTRNYTNDQNQVGWMANDGRYPIEETGCGWVPTKKVRIFPNHSRIRYEYPVHEMVEPSLYREGFKIERCNIPIHHYGPLSEVNKYQKMQTYYRMGKDKLCQLGDNPVALRELAIQAGILEKTAEAVDLWERLIVLKPNMAEAFVHLGTAYFQLKKYQAALKAAKKALELTPDLKEANYNYALCEFIAGDIRKSIACLEKLLVKSPGFLPAEFVLAAAHICSGQEKIGINRLSGINWTKMGSKTKLVATCKDLALRLMDQNRTDWAKTLVESVAKERKLRLS
jgi:tetratricopeptide (TPR) repeat protein